MTIAGVVLAAGEGRRAGGPKALLRIADRSFLAHACALLARPGVARVLTVLGHEADRVRRESGMPADVVVAVNERYRDGMLGSILVALDEAERLGADAVLLHPVDHPLVEPATVDRVVATLGDGAIIAVPSHDRRRGHPGGFARAAWSALRSASPEAGARAVLAAHPGWIVHVAGDAECVGGIDTPEEYVRLFGTRSTDDLAAEIADLAARNHHPFPYEDVRTLVRRADQEGLLRVPAEGLVPDLDLLFGTIQGWAESARPLLAGRRNAAGLERDLRRPFFEAHPAWAPLSAPIEAGAVPRLQHDLQQAERMRVLLLELASRMARQP
jgi:nicotine blue oxidoreductase